LDKTSETTAKTAIMAVQIISTLHLVNALKDNLLF